MKKIWLECLKYWGVLLFIWGVFLMPEVFAQNAQASSCSTNVMKWLDLMYNLQYFFSWIWIVLANLVGRLMTNAFVYGEFIGLDGFLWKIWQISRNIANFAIWFYFLYTILKFLLFPSEKDKNPKEIIKNSLIAGVLIQASWFIVMVIVDISSILFATASSLPSQVVANNSYLQKSLEASLEGKRNSDNQMRNNDPLHYRWKGKIVKMYVGIDEVLKLPKSPMTKQLSDGLAIEIIDKDNASLEQQQEEKFDMILPKHDSLSGPLMFLWLSIFRSTDFVVKGEHRGINCVDTTLKEVIIYVLHWGMIVLYTLALFVLLIVLIGRVAYLWIFIALSPIVFLLKYLKVIKTGNEVFWDLEKMIKLIFQPVLFALFMGIMMLVLITLSALFQSGADKDLGGAFEISTSENASVLSVPGVLEVGLRNTTLTFEHIMLGGMSLLFMWLLVKMAAETKTGIKSLDDLTTNITKFAQKSVMTTPLIPTPVGKIGLWTIYDSSTWSSILDKMNDKSTMYFTSRSEQETSKVMSMFGIKWSNKGLSSQQALQLQQIIKAPDSNAFTTYKTVVKEAMKTRAIGFADISSTLYNVLRSPYINYSNSSLQSIKAVIDGFTKPEDVKTYFEDSKNYHHFKLLYNEIFGTDEGMPPVWQLNDQRYRISPTSSS